MSRVLLVGKGPPDRGGISAFMQTLLGSELATQHRLSLLNLYRDEVLGGGRFTRANLSRTLGDGFSANGDFISASFDQPMPRGSGERPDGPMSSTSIPHSSHCPRCCARVSWRWWLASPARA